MGASRKVGNGSVCGLGENFEASAIRLSIKLHMYWRISGPYYPDLHHNNGLQFTQIMTILYLVKLYLLLSMQIVILFYHKLVN